MDINKQSAHNNVKSNEKIVNEDEETKEKKRQRNREYQRAWRQRHRDLKKKVLKEEKEAARRKRHCENQRAYYHRKKLLRESELNDELRQEKLEDLKLRRIWIEPCKKSDLEEKSISNKQNQSLCTLRFENKNGQNLLNKKSGPALLVPVSAFYSEKDKSTRNSADNVEAEKSQSERLKRHNKLPETDSKEIKIKEEEDEFDVFCRSLALQLKSMPFDRAQKCQEKLQAVISAELDQLDAPSSPKRWIQVEIPPSTTVTPPEPLIDIKVEPEELP